MVIAHAASLDVCTRQIVGHAPRNHADFHDVLHKIPYLAMAVCQEDCIIQVNHLVLPNEIFSIWSQQYLLFSAQGILLIKIIRTQCYLKNMNF